MPYALPDTFKTLLGPAVAKGQRYAGLDSSRLGPEAQALRHRRSRCSLRVGDTDYRKAAQSSAHGMAMQVHAGWRARLTAGRIQRSCLACWNSQSIQKRAWQMRHSCTGSKCPLSCIGFCILRVQLREPQSADSSTQADHQHGREAETGDATHLIQGWSQHARHAGTRKHPGGKE